MIRNTVKKGTRSLYECSHAIVQDEHILCSEGYRFKKKYPTIPLRHLALGKPLTFAICNDCNDFDRNGEPLPQSDRGWRKEMKPNETQHPHKRKN